MPRTVTDVPNGFRFVVWLTESFFVVTTLVLVELGKLVELDGDTPDIELADGSALLWGKVEVGFGIELVITTTVEVGSRINDCDSPTVVVTNVSLVVTALEQLVITSIVNEARNITPPIFIPQTLPISSSLVD